MVDFGRGNRGGSGGATSVQMFSAIAQRSHAPARVRLGCFRVPQQSSWFGRQLPSRWAEGVGVQHIKLYAFDDTVVLTGANLSNDYFTNRQDRCVVVSGDTPFAGAVHGTVAALHASSIDSRELQRCDPAQDKTAAFADYVAREFGPGAAVPRTPAALPPSSVLITPLAQFRAHGVNQDVHAMSWLSQHCPAQACMHFATGYFNATPEFRSDLLRSPAAAIHVLTAAPSANGFYGSAGMR